MKPTILLNSGNYFDYTHPEKSDFTVHDIAHALANICRFAGHTNEFYSVAQHCYHASFIVPAQHAMEALMHDAGEAFMIDLPAPLKMLCPDYKAIEKRIEAAIFDRFALPEKLHPCVKHADLIMLATEQRDLMNADPSDGEWEILEGIQPLAEKIKPWTNKVAKEMFLERFRVLYRQSLVMRNGFVFEDEKY